MLVYTVIAMMTVIAVMSLAVDIGRAQLAKTELQRAADAAARYGVTAADISTATVRSRAKEAAEDNLVNGASLTLQNSDIERGYWTGSAFTTSTTSTRAVRITARLANSRGTGLDLILAKVVGRTTIDMVARAVATYTPGVNTSLTAPSSGNPWLAGMPNGTTANGYDAAPANLPAQVTAISITPGSTLTFSFTGSASYYPGTQPFDPDGNPDWIINNYSGAEHGKSQLFAPLTAVVGVFLNDTQPNLAGSPPAALDFTSPASRDFTTLSPALRQPFFIGNGKRADGTTLQQFVVPAGATRFYLGIMDGQQWSDNSGSLTASVVRPAAVVLVD